MDIKIWATFAYPHLNSTGIDVINIKKANIKHVHFLNPGTPSASRECLIVSMPHFAVWSQAALRHPSLSEDCSSCHPLIPQQNEWLPYTTLPLPSWLFHLSEALSPWYTTWVHMWGAAETRPCRRLMRFPPCRDGAQYGLCCKLIWAHVRADMVCFRGVVVSENSNRICMALSNSCFGNLVGFFVRRDEMCSVVKYGILTSAT